MKQITLHAYQSVDGCPIRSNRYFDAAVDASGFMLVDEETYLRIYLDHLGWSLTAKGTLVVMDGCIDLTEEERVQSVTGDVAAGLRGIEANGEGMVTAYGTETGALFLDSGLMDEIVVMTMPVLASDGEKALECGLSDDRAWIVRSSKVSEDGKIRTIYGRVCP